MCGPRSLIQGTQMGMHVWLQLRFEGFCTEGLSVDRRVFDDASDALLEIQRGPVRLVEGAPGTLELDQPFAMQLCPPRRPIIDQAMRFAVRAEDDQGNVDIVEQRFVPVCTSADCSICVPP